MKLNILIQISPKWVSKRTMNNMSDVSIGLINGLPLHKDNDGKDHRRQMASLGHKKWKTHYSSYTRGPFY